jgi:hypothetical protein
LANPAGGQGSVLLSLIFKYKKMSTTTKALIKGVKKMLKNRGSLTVKEVELLRAVIEFLVKHDTLEGEKRLQNGMTIVRLLIRVLLNPSIGEHLSQMASHLIDKLS